MDGVTPVAGKRSATREQSLIVVDVECREARSAGYRMRRIGVAVEQLDLAFRTGHERVMNPAAGKYRAHRDGAVRDAFRRRHQIRRHAEIIGRERRAEPTEAG